MTMLTNSNKTQIWTDRLRRFTAAELTVAQFCQKEQVSVPSFYSWRRKLTPRIETSLGPSPKRTRSTAIARRRTPVAFAQVQVKPSAVLAQALLPNGVQISLGEQPEIVAVIVDRLMSHPDQESDSGTPKC